MLGDYDKCKVCNARGIFLNNICDDCIKEKQEKDSCICGDDENHPLRESCIECREDIKKLREDLKSFFKMLEALPEVEKGELNDFSNEFEQQKEDLIITITEFEL